MEARKETASGAAAEAAAEPEGPRVFDREGLLDRAMGDADFMREILVRFLAEIPPELDALESSLASGDQVQVQRRAHGIKGAAANAGAEALRQVAAVMQGSAGEGDPVANVMRMPELRMQFQRFQEAVRAALPGL